MATLKNPLELVKSADIGRAKEKQIPHTDNELQKAFLERSNSAATLRTYKNNLQEFLDFAELCSGRRIRYDEVTFREVTLWRESLKESGKTANTIITKLACLRSLFEFGRSLGVFHHNPASTDLVPLPKKPKFAVKGRALDKSEVKNLLSWFRLDDITGARNYALLLLMLRTSIRVSEAAQLRVSSIRWNGGRFVMIFKSKGGGQDVRPLPTDVKKAIDRYLEMDRSWREEQSINLREAFIFQSETKQKNFKENVPLSTRQIWHIVKRAGELTGIGKLSPHDLRRTAITQAFKLGIPIRNVQRMSGHADLRTLQIYDYDRENLDENAINELNYD